MTETELQRAARLEFKTKVEEQTSWFEKLGFGNEEWIQFDGYL